MSHKLNMHSGKKMNENARAEAEACKCVVYWIADCCRQGLEQGRGVLCHKQTFPAQNDADAWSKGMNARPKASSKKEVARTGHEECRSFRKGQPQPKKEQPKEQQKEPATKQLKDPETQEPKDELQYTADGSEAKKGDNLDKITQS